MSFMLQPNCPVLAAFVQWIDTMVVFETIVPLDTNVWGQTSHHLRDTIQVNVVNKGWRSQHKQSTPQRICIPNAPCKSMKQVRIVLLPAEGAGGILNWHNCLAHIFLELTKQEWTNIEKNSWENYQAHRVTKTGFGNNYVFGIGLVSNLDQLTSGQWNTRSKQYWYAAEGHACKAMVALVKYHMLGWSVVMSSSTSRIQYTDPRKNWQE